MSLWLRSVIYVGITVLSFIISLDFLDYYGVSSGTGCARSSCCPPGAILSLTPPIPRLEGYAYRAPVPQLRGLGDTGERPTRSPTVICEGELKLGPAHSPYAEVAASGLGRFSHFEGEIAFSASDNTDPNSNGRDYKIVVPTNRCRGFVFLLGFC
jgi:hypothetical protein